MKTNTTLIGESTQWLDSFEFIGTVFPIKAKKSIHNSSNTEYVVMCNTRSVSNQIQIVTYQEFLSYEQPMLIIKIGMDDEKFISKSGATVITDRILCELSIFEPLDDVTFNGLMKDFLGIDYDSVFNSVKLDEYKHLVYGKEFPHQCLRFIDEAITIIREQGITYDLMLEAKVYPIYQEIFRQGFLIDVDSLKAEYKMIENENQVMRQFFIEDYSAVPEDISLRSRLDKSGLEVLNRYEKNQKIMKKFPISKLIKKNGKTNPFLTCSYKQVGTKTLRISTSQVNLYGLPKRLKQYLIPHEDNVFIEADFHASELLIIANLAHEEWIIQSYESGQDIYILFAMSFFNKKATDIQPHERKAMKKLFFAYLNGGKSHTMRKILESLGIQMSDSDMNYALQRLKEKIPKVQTYLKSLRYKSNVKTPTGRWWSEDALPESYKRAAHIIQIVESEILFNAVLLIHDELSKNKDMRIYLTKHDSITIEASAKNQAVAKKILQKQMTKAVQLFFHVSRIHINITVTPYFKEKENDIMSTKNTMMDAKNKLNMATLKNLYSQVQHKKHKAFKLPRIVPEETYLAMIEDNTYDEKTDIARIDLTVFVEGETRKHIAKYNMSGNAAYYYDAIVDLLGDEDGNIVGKLCYVVFHQNEQFMNIEVIGEASEEELGLDIEEDQDEIVETKKPIRSKQLKTAKSLLEEEDDEPEFDDEDVEEDE